MVFIPFSPVPTSTDIPALADIKRRADAKFNAEQWLTATGAETWSVPGIEPATGVFANELIKQAGLEGTEPARVLDLGAGMGQVTQSLQKQPNIQTVAGDIDESYLEVLNIKKEAKGWDNVTVRNINATAIDEPDASFTHVFANFVYFLLKDPMTALKESIRVLKPGGTLGFTTWAHSGAFYLLQHAQALVPDAPDRRTPEITAMSTKNGSWHDRKYITKLLTDFGLEDIKIEVFDYKHERPSTEEVARDMWVVMSPFTIPFGPKRQEVGWKMFGAVEQALKGEGSYGFRNVSLVVTAKKPSNSA